MTRSAGARLREPWSDGVRGRRRSPAVYRSWSSRCLVYECRSFGRRVRFPLCDRKHLFFFFFLHLVQIYSSFCLFCFTVPTTAIQQRNRFFGSIAVCGSSNHLCQIKIVLFFFYVSDFFCFIVFPIPQNLSARAMHIIISLCLYVYIDVDTNRVTRASFRCCCKRFPERRNTACVAYFFPVCRCADVALYRYHVTADPIVGRTHARQHCRHWEPPYRYSLLRFLVCGVAARPCPISVTPYKTISRQKAIIDVVPQSLSIIFLKRTPPHAILSIKYFDYSQYTNGKTFEYKWFT